MEKIAVYFMTGVLVFSALNAAENASITGDAAIFAGKVNAGERYFRLGELALENDDAAAAADFFRQSLNSLQDKDLRIQATDRLLESLLAANRGEEAGKLLNSAVKDKLFAGSNMLKLMQARMLFYKHKNSSAVKLLTGITGKLDPADPATFPALELLSKALSNDGNYAAARKIALDMAVIAGDNYLKKFKAMENLIFLALANNDIKQAEKAFLDLKTSVPEDILANFARRIKKLGLLLECYTNKGKDIQKDFQNIAGNAKAPDPLLARIAYALAQKVQNTPGKAVEYAKLAYKFAEGAFRQTALKKVIILEIDGKFWQDALDDALNFMTLFPKAPGQDSLMAVIGDLYIQLGKTDDAVRIFAGLCKDKNADMAERCSAAGKLARLYQKQDKVPEAAAMFKFAIENIKDKDLKSSVQHEFGEYLYKLGRYSDAAGYFRLAALGSKTPEKSQLYLAQSLYMLKSYDAAAEELAAIKSPAGEDIIKQMAYLDALITEQLGRTDEAIGKFSVFAQKYKSSPEASEALFHAGTLALSSKKFNGAEMLQLYAGNYPGEKAANALYKALSALLAENREAAAVKLLNTLTEKYPESKFTVAGNFRRVDFLRENSRYKEALSALEIISSRYSSTRTELIPEILYDRAVICGALNDHAGKLKALEELTGKYADHALAGRAFFMLGDLKAASGDAEAALAAFQQAEKRSVGTFAYGCTGRTGDAAYTLYSKQRKEEYLLQAMESYERLLKNNDLSPSMQMQTMYKLGRCLEDKSDVAGALSKYREIIYGSLLCKRQNRFYQEIWSIKALDGALRLILQAVRETSEPDHAQQLKSAAERLLKAAFELNLPGEDINKQLELVQKTVPAAR